jgi:YidC/Oxa1 family membrane protein insertase
MTAFLFEGPAWLLAKFYDFFPNYIVAISLIALVVMIITAPLQLKATKGMLEMQKLQPELRKLQQEHRGDRQKLNEEMMKLYQQHKVNPLASCFPLLLQFPGAVRRTGRRDESVLPGLHPGELQPLPVTRR